MKISLMVMLVVTIAALSHFAVIRNATMREAIVRARRGVTIIPPRWAKGDRGMWISVFAVVIVVALCLGAAAFILQPSEIV